MQYTNIKLDQNILDYFYAENLDRFVDKEKYPKLDYKYTYSAGFEVNPNLNVEFVPDINDLVRLHKMVRHRKSLTILEFGIGYSTLVYADALMKNQKDFNKIDTTDLCWNNQFEVHSVDCSEIWIKHFKKKLAKYSEIAKFIHLYYSPVKTQEYNGQICHFYQIIPDIIPDFIYLDGPCPHDSKGDVNSMTFQQTDRTVMSGDILKMESTLHPGTFILVDGRSNNARFLKNNFKRDWEYINHNNKVTLLSKTPRDEGQKRGENVKKMEKFVDWNENDITTFELVEFPLNFWNYKRLVLCDCLNEKYFT